MKQTKVLDIDILLKTISETFAKFLKEEYPKEFGVIVIEPFYPSDDLKSLTEGMRITYHLEDRRPQSLDGKPFQNRTFLSPRPMNTKMVAGLQNSTEWEFRYDNLVEFQIHSLNYNKLIKATLAFEEFMILSRTLFKQRGVEEVLFWERRPDEQKQVGSERIYIAALRYYVRTLRVFEDTNNVIRKIDIALQETLGS